VLLAAVAAAVLCAAHRVMVVVAPESTTFQRSEAWQQWKDGAERRAAALGGLRPDLGPPQARRDLGRRPVHGTRRRALGRHRRPGAQRQGRTPRGAQAATRPARLYGGSTITQQLAKNLLLSGERNLLRKGQELVLAHCWS
jgi:monofunctional biosynthetic peptidoglycan transglycosylase